MMAPSLHPPWRPTSPLRVSLLQQCWHVSISDQWFSTCQSNHNPLMTSCNPNPGTFLTSQMCLIKRWCNLKMVKYYFTVSQNKLMLNSIQIIYKVPIHKNSNLRTLYKNITHYTTLISKGYLFKEAVDHFKFSLPSESPILNGVMVTVERNYSILTESIPAERYKTQNGGTRCSFCGLIPYNTAEHRHKNVDTSLSTESSVSAMLNVAELPVNQFKEMDRTS